MKDKKKMRLIIALAVLLLGGLVYYWFFYTPSLGDYVYLERRNLNSAVAHSIEDCGEIKGGITRLKTDEFLDRITPNGYFSYCNKCISIKTIHSYKKSKQQ